jgi:TonB-dependent SusC/RagA subfamily outer membrane receptor
MFSVAACSSERSMSPAPQPQKSALLQCSVDGMHGSRSCGPMPLLVIDGKRMSWDGSDLNPSEIESVEVLKGQAALRLYGVDGRNGVVQITTRKILKF